MLSKNKNAFIGLSWLIGPTRRTYFSLSGISDRKTRFSRVVPVNRKVLLYISKDSLAGSLHNGDELVLMARVSPPSNNGNPDEFDYARYLRYRGIGELLLLQRENGR